MKQQVEIIAIEGVKVVTVFKENGEEFQQVTNFEALNLMLQNGIIELSYDSENEELENEIQNAPLGYVEVAEPLSEDEEGFEVYKHEAIVEDGEVKIDFEGQYLKTYKTMKGAQKFANSLN